jgi:hypothetical protein
LREKKLRAKNLYQKTFAFFAPLREIKTLREKSLSKKPLRSLRLCAKKLCEKKN